MSPRFTPTVRQLPPAPVAGRAVARLAVAAAIAGAAITAMPGVAHAAPSTCSYNTSNKNLIINDRSGTAPLKIFRTPAGEIRYSDGTNSAGFVCLIPNTPNTATITNTERIAVFSDRLNSAQEAGDGFLIDQNNGPLGPGVTPEADGNSELEVHIDTQAAPSTLTMIGTSQADEIRVGKGGAINSGFATTPTSDQDVDVSMTTEPMNVTVFSRGGNDLVSGHGNEASRNPLPYNRLLTVSSSEGADFLIGSDGIDFLKAGNGDDRYFAVDGQLDAISEVNSDGNDVAEIDAGDDVFGAVEQRFVSSSVGRMKLTPAAVSTDAGEPARVKLGWKHPQGWKQLRSLELLALNGGKQIGAVRIDPAHGRVSARGALDAMPSSKVGHHGKTVTAELVLRPSKRLAGRSLRLAVQARDVHGKRQLEPLAGSLTIAR